MRHYRTKAMHTAGAVADLRGGVGLPSNVPALHTGATGRHTALVLPRGAGYRSPYVGWRVANVGQTMSPDEECRVVAWLQAKGAVFISAPSRDVCEWARGYIRGLVQ